MLRLALRHYVDAFRGLPREIWLVSFASMVNRAGMMVLPFLSLYLREALGFSAESISWILLAFGLGSGAGNWIAGRLIDRWGALVVQNISLLGGGLAFLCLPLLHSLPSLVVGVFVTALVADAFRPACMAATAQLAPAGTRTRALALLRLAVNVGMAVGPTAGGLLAGIDYTWIFVAEAMTCWLAALLLMTTLRGVRPRNTSPSAESFARESTGRRRTHLDPRLLVFLGLVLTLGVAFFQVFHVMPLYLKDAYGFPERTIGMILGFNALLIVLLEMPLVHGLERRNPWHVFGVGAALVGAGLAMTPLGRGELYILAIVSVWSLGEMLSLPFSNAIVASMGARAGAMGRYMGYYGMTFALSSILAPVIGLRVYASFGGDMLWYGAGVCGLLVLGASIVMGATRRGVALAQGS